MEEPMAVVDVAPVVIEEPGEHGFARQLTWWDGFAISLVVPIGIFVTIGPTIGLLGSWATITVFGIAASIGVVQNFIFAEMAAMFPNKPGGIALYAHEAWRKYLAPVGALAAFGYWAGWALSNSIFALTFGDLIAAQFFPHATWSISTGTAHVGLGAVIGIPVLLSAWFLNIRGIRPMVQINKVLAVFSVGLMALLVIGPLVTGKLHVSAMSWNLGQPGQAWGGVRLAIVFLFIAGWTSYATEICATFAPEYRDQRRDTTRSLRAAGAFTLLVAVLLPLGLGGTVGDSAIAGNPGAVYATAFKDIVGPASGLVTILICAGIYLIMSSCTADAGRALYGIARDDMTIKQLNQLNRHGVPSRALTADLIVNLALLIFVSSVLGIIFASNVGYFFAVIAALTGFLLLRRDRPQWPRPIRLGAPWLPIAAVLALVNTILLVVGFFDPEDAGYGGLTEQLIGVAILASSLVLFVFRRIVQDRTSLRLREVVPQLPSDLPAGASTASR
jgi:amino acid transporter